MTAVQRVLLSLGLVVLATCSAALPSTGAASGDPGLPPCAPDSQGIVNDPPEIFDLPGVVSGPTRIEVDPAVGTTADNQTTLLSVEALDGTVIASWQRDDFASAGDPLVRRWTPPRRRSSYNVRAVQTFSDFGSLSATCETQATQTVVVRPGPRVVPGGPMPAGTSEAVCLVAYSGCGHRELPRGWRGRAVDILTSTDDPTDISLQVTVSVRCVVARPGSDDPIIRSVRAAWTPPAGTLPDGPVSFDFCAHPASGGSYRESHEFRAYLNAYPRRVTPLRKKRWSLTIGGRRLRAGWFGYQFLQYTPPSTRRIYQDNFDQYVNYCINGGHTTWASGGRLYCNQAVPGSGEAWAALFI